MSVEYRDIWLERFYENDIKHRAIPNSIEKTLYRKLQILDAAHFELDLRIPPVIRPEISRHFLW